MSSSPNATTGPPIPLSVVPAISLDNILGAYLVFSFLSAMYAALYLSAILFGVLCLQCYLFLQSSDPKRGLVKCSIWAILALNAFHTANSIQACYHWMVTNFSNLEALVTHGPWSACVLITCSVTSNFIVQGWFTWRLWILSNKKKIIVAFLIPLILATWVSGFVLSMLVVPMQSFTDYAKVNWLIYLAHSLDIVTNFVLTTSLLFYLARMRKSPISRTRVLIHVLILYAVNTGLVGFLEILTTIILRSTRPNDLLFISVYIPYSTLYSNALLGSLNGRDWFRNQDSNAISIPLSSYRSAGRSTLAPMSLTSAATRETNSSGTLNGGVVVHVDKKMMQEEL